MCLHDKLQRDGKRKEGNALNGIEKERETPESTKSLVDNKSRTMTSGSSSFAETVAELCCIFRVLPFPFYTIHCHHNCIPDHNSTRVSSL